VLSTHFAAKSRRGVADLIACHRGVFLALECKSPANDHPLSPTQRLELLAVEHAGGLTCVVKDEADVERALDFAEAIASGRAADSRRTPSWTGASCSARTATRRPTPGYSMRGS
jgi:hypothetical protein